MKRRWGICWKAIRENASLGLNSIINDMQLIPSIYLTLWNKVIPYEWLLKSDLNYLILGQAYYFKIIFDENLASRGRRIGELAGDAGQFEFTKNTSRQAGGRDTYQILHFFWSGIRHHNHPYLLLLKHQLQITHNFNQPKLAQRGFIFSLCC